MGYKPLQAHEKVRESISKPLALPKCAGLTLLQCKLDKISKLEPFVPLQEENVKD